MQSGTGGTGSLFPAWGTVGRAVWGLLLALLPAAAIAQDLEPGPAPPPVDLTRYEAGALIPLDPSARQHIEARLAAALGVDPAEVATVGLMKAPAPERFCQLRPTADAHGGHYLRVPEPPRTAASQAATFAVTYDTDFQNDDAARGAFQRAVDTWSAVLNSSQTITVSADWDALSPGVLGSAGPGAFYGVTVGSATHWYSLAMTEALTGSNYADPDIVARFGSQFSNWYTGTGAPGSSEYDLESVVLHELGHGLGFVSLTNLDDGVDNGSSNPAECQNVANEGCLLSGSYMARFDGFLEDSGGTLLSDTGTYTDPSTALGGALVSDALYFGGPLAEAANSSARVALYAPPSWSRGSSIAHLGEAFNETANTLMTYSIGAGELARAPGPVTCGLLRDLAGTGFVDQSGCASLPLPVELVRFDARQDGRAVVLTWTTATETNNAGFDVEQASPVGAAWETVGFVAGKGTTLERQTYHYRIAQAAPGHTRFRLRQRDFDGTTAFSPEVDVTITIPTRYEAAVYPNPFNAQAAVTLTVATEQPVRVEILNALGQRIAVLHDGILPAYRPQRFSFAAETWPTGLYLVRITGATFHDTRRAILVK